MSVPANLKYTKEHEWIRVEGNEAFVGITDFAQSELGEIVFVEVETVGETLSEGEVFGTVEAVKTVSDLYLPVDAKVLEFNNELEDAPELVNDDPYSQQLVSHQFPWLYNKYLGPIFQEAPAISVLIIFLIP